MKQGSKRRLLYELNTVLDRYSLTEYNPEAVIEILSRSLRRKKCRMKEIIKTKEIKPYVILREQRKRMGYSLDELSRRSGIAKPNISAIENNKRPMGLKTTKQLAKAMGIHFKTLL